MSQSIRCNRPVIFLGLRSQSANQERLIATGPPVPKQAQLNACLDLDKHEAQVVDEPREPEEEAAARRPHGSAPAMVRAVQPPAVVER